MGRNKTLTTVSINPDVFQIGREEGYNFSQLLEDAIVERNDPKREVIMLQGKIRYHEEEATRLKGELKLAEDKVRETEKTKIDRVLERFVPIYKEWGFIKDEDMNWLTISLHLKPEEINKI